MTSETHANHRPSSKTPTPERIAERYRVLERIGEGGMATVYRGYDEQADRDIALKRLRRHSESESARRMELFEREFHTLSQLAHPSVVAVYEYGFDEQGPYYTMELLDGLDLSQAAPLEWRTACSLGRDICSALALLHSRSLVYRDLGPRNVRCTSRGQAKLIDFGAMSAMGPSKMVVGTPPICAPEAVYLQPLDARTDLYALGATLYFALVGRHAYPARELTQLPTFWQHAAPPPSARVEGIPAALDTLIMELLQPDAALRPASAAEVMDRLSAIARLEVDEHLLVSRAYLTTPRLVGRDRKLERMRRRLAKASSGQGRSVAVLSGPGVGRTRLLDATVLEARLQGALVARADATDATGELYATARALGARLLESAPEIAKNAARRHGDLLAQLAPQQEEGVAESADRALDDPKAQKRFQADWVAWLLEVSRHHNLVLAIDDVDRIDELSAACLALLAQDIRDHAILLAMTALEDGARSSVLASLIAASARTELRPLSGEESEALLRSLFGDVPHVAMLAHELHQICGGRPRDLMQLAQHLVDKGLLRYSAGAWSLPARLEATDLPSSMTEALRSRLEALDADALEVAQALSLGSDQHFRFEELRMLAGHDDAGRLMRSLEALRSAGIVTPAGDSYIFNAHGWAAVLAKTLDTATRRQLHLRIAAVLETRGSDEVHRAKHLFEAEEPERALDVLVAHAEASRQETDVDPNAFSRLVRSLPEGWLSLYDRAWAHCTKLGRPREHEHALQERVVAMASTSREYAPRYVLAVLEHYRRDSGLDIYLELDAGLDPQERLHRALALAQNAHDEASDQERLLPPAEAIRALGRTGITAAAVAAAGFDVELWRKLPSVAPFVPLAPALGIVQKLLEGIGKRITGRLEQAHAIYLELLERLEGADSGLDESYRQYTIDGLSYVVGTLEAPLGLASSLEHAERVERSSLYGMGAPQIRILYHLWQGGIAEAERWKRRAERMRLEKVHQQPIEGASLIREVAAYAVTDDLTRIKQMLPNLERGSARMPAWTPVLHWARAEYRRIRGDHTGALEAVEAALADAKPGEHQVWPEVAATHLRTLIELGRESEAVTLGRGYVQSAEEHELGYLGHCIRLPLAVAQARSGHTDAAVENAEACLRHFESLGATGLNLALAHEARAWVALILGDAEGCEAHAAQIEKQCHLHGSRSFSARVHYLQRLLQDLRHGKRPQQLALDRDAPQIAEALRHYASKEARSRRALELLLEHSSASAGFLYEHTRDGLELCARSCDHELPPEMLDTVHTFITCDDDDMQTEVTAVAEVTEVVELPRHWTDAEGRMYRPVLLNDPDPLGEAASYLAVLQADAGEVVRYDVEVAAEIGRALAEPITLDTSG